MFRDELEVYEEEFEKLLEAYTLEEILEMSDLTPAKALAILFLESCIEIPETKPVR